MGSSGVCIVLGGPPAVAQRAGECDGLKGLPEAITATWPQATVQTCVVHLVRASLRYASKKYWQAITRDLKRISPPSRCSRGGAPTAPSLPVAETEFEAFAQQWEGIAPAMIALWRRAGEDGGTSRVRGIIPFLDFPVEVRKIIYTTNSIESLNARFGAATRRRGHVPDERCALMMLYLAIRQREVNRPNPTGQINGWKNILNVLSLTYGDRLGLNEQPSPLTQKI